MLTIKPIENEIEIKAYLSAQGIILENVPRQFMAMYDGNEICGLGALTLEEAKVYMDFLHVSGDTSLLFGLAKSLLNMADLRGIKTIYGKNPALENTYTALHFKKDEGEFVLSLEGYFTVPCAH
ncbi:MAG: hypothetical protein IKW06_04165 [Clostridia bacterium]|nr:hypothetical protein [Clostridia bacterium]